MADFFALNLPDSVNIISFDVLWTEGGQFALLVNFNQVSLYTNAIHNMYTYIN